MNQHNKITRFFAATFVVGGIIGGGFAAMLGVLALFSKGGWPFILLMGMAAFFVWVTFIGFELWKGTPYGRKWAIIPLISQIPALKLHGFTYQWCTGACFYPIFRLDTGFTNAGFLTKIGVNYQLSFVTGIIPAAPPTIGINLLAPIAIILLIYYKNSFKPKPLHGLA